MRAVIPMHAAPARAMASETSAAVLGGAQALYAIVRTLLQFRGYGRLCRYSFFFNVSLDRTEGDYQYPDFRNVQ
jgi:hypothetical protein